MIFAARATDSYTHRPLRRVASHSADHVCHAQSVGRSIMQTYDLLMLLVLVAATMFGFWKGMAWQIASLASLVVSYFAALQFSERLAPTFGDTAPWNRFVAMLVIYIVTSFIIWTVFRLVSGVIDKVRLEAFDKQLGAMFGFAKGVLLVRGDHVLCRDAAAAGPGRDDRRLAVGPVHRRALEQGATRSCRRRFTR